MDPVVEVTDLVVDRGRRRVLHGVSCTVSSGSVTGLLGPSGSGKSTLMRAVVGVQTVRSGQVRRNFFAPRRTRHQRTGRPSSITEPDSTSVVTTTTESAVTPATSARACDSPQASRSTSSPFHIDGNVNDAVTA